MKMKMAEKKYSEVKREVDRVGVVRKEQERRRWFELLYQQLERKSPEVAHCLDDF